MIETAQDISVMIVSIFVIIAVNDILLKLVEFFKKKFPKLGKYVQEATVSTVIGKQSFFASER